MVANVKQSTHTWVRREEDDHVDSNNPIELEWLRMVMSLALMSQPSPSGEALAWRDSE